jgi:hypothetical protein
LEHAHINRVALHHVLPRRFGNVSCARFAFLSLPFALQLFQQPGFGQQSVANRAMLPESSSELALVRRT